MLQLLKKFSLQCYINYDNRRIISCSKRQVQCHSYNLSHYFQRPQRCITCDDCKATFVYANSAEHTQIVYLIRQKNYFKKKCNQQKKEQLEFIREYYGIASDEELW